MFFSLSKFSRAVRYALTGFRWCLREEQSLRVHLLLGLAVLIIALWLSLPLVEIAIVVLIITLLIVLEFINTIIERLLNLLVPEKNELVRNIKDASAAMVLVASVGAIAVGLLIFLPPIISLFTQN